MRSSRFVYQVYCCKCSLTFWVRCLVVNVELFMSVRYAWACSLMFSYLTSANDMFCVFIELLEMAKFLKDQRLADTTSSTLGSTRIKKKRLNDDIYLKFGFTVFQNKPQCIIYYEILTRESISHRSWCATYTQNIVLK